MQTWVLNRSGPLTCFHEHTICEKVFSWRLYLRLVCQIPWTCQKSSFINLAKHIYYEWYLWAFSLENIQEAFLSTLKLLRIAFISGQGSAASAFRPSSLDVIQTSWTPHFLKSLEFNPVPCHFKPQTSPISPSPLLLDIGCSRICHFSYRTTCWKCIRNDWLIQI